MAKKRAALLGNLGVRLTLLLTAAGCGGGGGSSSSGVIVPDGPVLQTSAPTPIPLTPAEYERNYGLDLIGADYAYSLGGTGAGIRVGVIDTGIDTDHPDLLGGIDPASTDIVRGSAGSVEDSHGHGTAVAGVIGARRNGLDAHGVAFDSSILAVRADGGTVTEAGGFFQSDLARATDYAANAGARVINYSVVGDELSAELAAALNRAASRDAVLVMAAGNDGAGDPAATAAYHDAAVAGRLIAVGAVDRNGSIASFSNRAGTAQGHYLVAPGVGIVTTALGGGTGEFHGTSFATPHVAGAAATIMSAAPHLTGREVAELLLTTARDLGAAGVDPIYGRGMVDLEAALKPQGEPVVPTGETVAAGGTPLSETELQLGAAFGDALSRSGALAEVAFLDSYGRAYGTDLRSRVAANTRTPDLTSWLGAGVASAVAGDAKFGRAAAIVQNQSGSSPGLLDRAEDDPVVASALTFDLPGGAEATVSRGVGVQSGVGLVGAPTSVVTGSLDDPFAAIAPAGSAAILAYQGAAGWRLAVGLGESENGVGNASTRLGEVSHRWENGVRLGVQLGAVDEQGSVLGGEARGAFAAGGGAETTFGTLFADVPLGNRVSLKGAYTRGSTDLNASEGSLFQNFSTLGSSAFGFGIEIGSAFAQSDRLTFAASRPLRVDSGVVELAIPVGRTMEGAVVRRRETVALSPSGEELNLGLSYRRPIGTAEVQVDAGVRLEPGHLEDAAPEHLFAAKLHLPF